VRDAQASDSRGVASALTGNWIVVPGTDGVCLIPGDRSMTCGSLDGFEEGGLAMTVDPTVIGQRYIEGEPPLSRRGSGSVQGVVPNDVTRITGLDAAGNEIGRTTPHSNVYDLEVAPFRDLAGVELLHADGSTTTRPLGPGRQ
jgi:hypothetical protein